MTRFKKEMIKKGFDMECTLPWLPYKELEGIKVAIDGNKIRYTREYVSIVVIDIYNSKMELVEQDYY